MVNIIRKFVIVLKGVLSPVFNSNKYADEETGDKRRLLFCINLELYIRREDIGVSVFSGILYNSPADRKALVPGWRKLGVSLAGSQGIGDGKRKTEIIVIISQLLERQLPL